MSSFNDIRSGLLKKYNVRPSDEEDRKESNTGTTVSTPDTTSDFYSIRENLLGKYSQEKTYQRRQTVSDWASRYNKVMENLSSGFGDSGQWKTSQDMDNMEVEIGSLLRDYEEIREYADRTGLPNAFRYANELKKLQEDMPQYRDYFGQWDSQEGYDGYLAEQAETQKKKTLDLDAYQTELDDLDDQILQVKNKITAASLDVNSMVGSGLPAETSAAKRLSDLRLQLSDLEKARNQKSTYLNDARRLQEWEALSGVSNPQSPNYDPEFQKYAGYSSTKADNLWDRVWSQYSMGYGDLTYEYINGAENGMRDQILQKARAFNAGSPSDDGETIFEKNSYDQMTEDEIGIYNYYYAKDGKEKAEQYLDSIQESLNYRKATAGFSNLEGKTGLEMIFGVAAGLDQFESGVKNLVNTKDQYIPHSSTQFLSGMVREDLEDVGPSLPDWLGGVSLGQMAYDTVTTSANMVPSILTSMAVSIVNPAAGSVAGAGLLGASAAGNAYQEALNQGYDQSQARAYSAMIGASEAGLQYLLGGISKLGGKITGPAVTKMLNGIDNGILRTAAKIGGNMVSEGFEEGLQEVLTPWFESLALGIDEDVNWSDAAYSFLLGAFTAGVMEGPNTVVGEVNTYNTGRQLQKAGVTANRLAEIGSTMSADSVAYRLAGKVDANTGAYTMGRMFQEIGAEITAQNQSDIQNALVSRGVAQRDAAILANGFADVVAGAELTEAQSAAIEANDVLSQVVQDVIINPNSTVYQRSQGYNEILKSLANERAGVSASRESAPVSDADIRSEEDDIPSENESDQRAAVGFESESAEFSDEGRTILSSTGEEVTIQEIVANGNGRQQLRLEDGRVVDSSDVSFGSEGEALVYEAISNMGVNPSAANILVKNYDPGQGITANEYVQQIQNAYRFGQLSIPEADLMSSPMTDRLNDRQRDQAYRLGKMFGGKQVAKEQAIARKGRSKSTESKGRVRFDGDRSNLTDIQKTSISALETVADTLGVQIYLFESSVDENGKRTGANGWYDPKDGSIHIDLYAGMNGEGTMLFTAAHELTHYIKQWSPAKFKVLANFLMKEYGHRGVSVDQLVTAQMEKAERSGRELSYEEAYEELIADSMESMLSDGNVIQKLAKLKEQDKSLWQKIKDFINDLAAKIKKAYAGLSPDSAEGRYVAQMKDAIDKLQDLFVEGLADASSNFQVSEQILMKSGIEVNSDTESGSIYSVRDVLSEKDRENVAKSLSDRFEVTMEEARSWLTAETSMASLILNPKYSTYLDYEGDPSETAIKTNSDYPQGTVDFSNICKKRREFTDVMNRILRNFPNHVFAATDLAKIRTIMGQEGLTLPCGICYVEDRRQLDTIIAQDFIDSLRLYREGSNTRADGKPFNSVQAKALQMVGEDTYVPTIYELVSLEGRNKLKAKNPAMEAAWVKYNNARGMQAARLLTNEAEYKRQILKYNKKTVQKKNDHGGLRIYSFSDAEMFHLIDIIQVITDSAAVGLSIQGYTKVNEYAKAVKDTGEKLNRSLIPKGDYGYHMEDGKVVLDYDTVEGIDINSKDFFDNKDNPNVGNITIGVSDVQIRAAMVSDFVDQIIPFHTGQSKDVLREKGISTWKNYKDFQTEKDLATGRTSNHQVNIYTEVIQAAEEEGNPIQNKRQFVEKFLKVCKDNGLQPRFSQFLNTDGNGDFVYTEGYHKLLVDFKTFAQTEVGEYLPQMPVKPIFDDAYITGLLKDYVKEQQVKDAKVAKQMPNVIRRITDEIINADSVKYSTRDSMSSYEIEGRINYLRETISALEDDLDFAEGTEASQISRDLAKLNYELDDLIAKERRAAKKTPLSEILDRLGDYRISDLESLAEQLSEGAWDGYEDLDRSDLEEGIREMIEERGYTPIEMQNVKYGLFVRPVESSSAKILRLQQRERRPETVVKMLRDQNTKLQEDLQEAKELVKLQGQVTGGKVLNQSSIMAAAKYLKGQWEVSGDTREFASILKPFYNHILTGDEISWNTVVENAQPVVDFMIRNGKINMDSIDPHITKQDMLRDVYDSYWRVSTLYTTADRYSRQINDLKGHQAQKMDALRERKNQEIDRKISKLKKSHDERIQKIREEQRERVKRLQEDQKQALEKTREKYRKRLDDQYEKLTTKYRESRKNAIDSRNRTAMRHKVQKVVKELNDYLLKGTKERHVPIELQKAVAEALDAVNMDTVGAAERIAKLEADLARAKTPEQMQEITHRIDNVRAAGENMSAKLTALKDAYAKFVDSDDPMIANSYDSVISDKIESVIDSVGNTALRDMTIRQLEDVYDMYRMVLTTVRNANKAFRAAKGETITQLSSEVMSQLSSQKSQPELQTKVAEGISRFRWNNLKPVYAFERIGSSTFTSLFNRVRSGEDTWAVDVTEARDFFREQAKKYNFDSWDFDSTHTFESASGAEFSLSLQQIMSLYAFSKREQALDHLRRGGIVIDSSTEVTKKTALGIKRKFNPTKATSYNIKDETLADIVSTLTADQKAFADAMQGYLSTTMGAKGNEVSLELYGIKLFKEKNYFPLRSATQFMAKAKEQQQVDPKIKNKGFTKETVRKASNPIVLTPFMNVWAGHVNEMSMYHAFTLPMEDFYRVYNFKTPTSEKTATKSVEMLLQNAHGKAATAYIDQLLRDLNGGVRADASAGIINKGIGMFKKGAVFASLSVVVQQPSAIARAAALIDTKYFIGPKVDPKRHAALWAEVKKYAPIAIIKEMGYFDTNMGMSTYDFITSKEYSGFKEKMKAAVSDSNYRDEILSKAPALADELAWCGIWEAVKRETAANNKSMDVRSDAFLKKCGERFTDVIVKTQVYDSVLSRSALMRSKDTGVKMATSFMAESTTSINMVEDALIKGKNGDKTFARREIGSVIASQILNSILVAFVYAARDDDEEKTYLEKYLGHMSSGIVEGLNPGNYLPFIRDIISIAQGYDVERSDMSIASDIFNSWKKLSSSTLSPYRKVENFVGSIAMIFGLPVKNIMRDARGIYNTINSFLNGKNSTWTGTRYAIQENLPGILGGGAVSRQNRLYTAIVNGDEAYVDRLKGSHADDASYRSAIREALRANDSRIRDAAVARQTGDLDEYSRIAYEIIGEGNFDQDTVVVAINAEINAMSTDTTTSSSAPKSQSLYDTDDFATAIIQGDQAMANAIRKEIIRVSELNGKTEEDAADSFSRSAKSVLKDQFVSGNIGSSQVVNALVTYCGESKEDAEEDVQYWDFTVRYPDVYADDSWFDAYNKNIADYGISIDTYMEYRDIVRNITGEGKKERRMAIIDSLPISDYQKDAMYYAEGWAESTINDAPWR